MVQPKNGLFFSEKSICLQGRVLPLEPFPFGNDCRVQEAGWQETGNSDLPLGFNLSVVAQSWMMA